MSSTYQRPVVFDEYMSMFILMGAMPNNTSGGRSGGVSPSPLLYTEVARMRYTSRGKVRNTLAPRGNLLVKVPKDNQSTVSSKQSRKLHTPDFQNIGSMKTTAQCCKMPLRCWRNHVGRYRFLDQELFRSPSVRVDLIYIYIYFVNRTILPEYNRSGVRLFRFWTFAKYSKFLPFPQDGLDHEESGGNDRPQLLVSEGLRPGMQTLIILENNGLK